MLMPGCNEGGGSQDSGGDVGDSTGAGSDSTGDAAAIEVVWENNFPSDAAAGTSRPQGLATNASGDLFVVALAEEGVDGSQLAVVAYDVEGEYQWTQIPSVDVGALESVAVAANGDRVAVAAGVEDDAIDGHHRIWEFGADGSAVRTIVRPTTTFGGGDIGIAVGPSGLVITTEAEFPLGPGSATAGMFVEAYTDASDEPAWVWSHAEDNGGATGNAVVLTDDGRVVASGVISGDAWLVQLSAAGEEISAGPVAPEGFSPTDLVHGPDGSLYLIRGRSVVVIGADGTPGETLDFGDANPSIGLDWSDGAFVVGAAWEDDSYGASIYDGDALRRSFSHPTALDYVSDVAWLPGGDIVMLGSIEDHGRLSISRLRLL